MRFFYAIALLIGLISSCKKPEDRLCSKPVGVEDTLEIPLNDFDQLFMHDRLIFVLVQDSTNKLVITGGKNLIGHVRATIDNGQLEIENMNKCNFLRSYKKKIKVEVHFTSLINLRFEGSEPLTNQGKMKFDWLTFLLKDGAGSVHLNFDAQEVYATISEGWGDFTFSGNVNYANLNIRSNGYCDIYGLNIADSITVVSNTQGDIKVNANAVKFKAQTLADGNIYYKGTPSQILFDQQSNGQLIHVN